MLAGTQGVLTSQLFTHNRLSDYGTLNARRLPSYLTNNPLPDGKPWGSKTDTHTNVYTDAADTGVARNYDFTITRAQISPDGYQMNNMFLVNGQFPGPLIEANWGDQIVVTVHNNITEDPEGFSMHWHGFLQSDTPWMDGVPGVTECPIVPGQSYTYSFNASMYGSTWYHSHYSAQYSSGVVGPMVIYGPSSATDANVIDVGPVMLSGWCSRCCPWRCDQVADVRHRLVPY